MTFYLSFIVILFYSVCVLQTNCGGELDFKFEKTFYLTKINVLSQIVYSKSTTLKFLEQFIFTLNKNYK